MRTFLGIAVSSITQHSPLEQAVLSWTKRVRKAVHKLIHAGRYSAAHVEKADEKFGVVSEAVRPVSR